MIIPENILLQILSEKVEMLMILKRVMTSFKIFSTLC